jgi:hypothetical protein
MVDNLKYYHLEDYLFEDVHDHFHSQGQLGAFDFFSIIVWKANRAKSLIGHKLISHSKGKTDLEAIVRTLTTSLYKAGEHKERMRLLIEDWKFSLPMASAILAVLYPDEFTVYDYKVCDILQDFHRLKNLTKFDKLWSAYGSFCARVKAETPQILNLREKDRYLCGKYDAERLKENIEKCFQN